jgi:crotonobetainyl-CoA:carnitine CoA-transferase CaiB-like acyl-CoA transferase
VVDLSSLWAGPLCAHLLGRAGCRVVKVEHPDRLDGARHGDARFWRWLHEGHESLVVDFRARPGRHQLVGLLEEADVIIEASRGRALDQLGLGPSQVSTKPGAVWVTITGYGRSSDRVAFGDDAAVAAGLVASDDRGPMFCGDAIGDPVAGLSAAVAVTEALAGGGGVHLDVSMAAAVAATAGPGTGCVQGEHPVTRDADGAWWVSCDGVRVPVRSPRSPRA